jgi:muramoyltetrapeptide carboxypeptidase
MNQTRRTFLRLASTIPILPLLALDRAGGAFRSPIRKPKRLKAGDTVGLVSPASITYDPVLLDIMREVLAALELQMKLDPRALNRWGYFAGTDEERASSMNDMFADPDVDAIFALQGGWGSSRLLPYLDYGLIANHPKIFLGYSDITALLLALYARSGLVTFHGPTGNSTWNQFSVGYLRRILFAGEALTMENPKDREDNLAQVKDRIRTITPGKARGRLAGGNLTVLSSIVGSDYLPDWSGHILFLEDTNEEIYRIDRMLTQLKLAGILQKVSGFVFGKCTDCEVGSGYSSFTLEEILTDHFKPLGIPAFHGSMIGHVKDKFTVPLGIEVEIDAGLGTIAMLEPAVLP